MPIRSPGVESLRRLTRTARMPPHLHPDPLGRDELAPEAANALWAGLDKQGTCDALYSLWLDVRRGRQIPEELLKIGLLRTAEVLVSISPVDSTNVYEALDESFGAIVQQKLLTQVPTLDDAFRTAVLDAIHASERRFSVNEIGVSTLASLINTVASVWPHEVGISTFCLPLGVTEKLSEWTIAYLSVLAYQTQDNPLLTQPVYLWERLGQSYGVRLSKSTCEHIRPTFGERRIERVLRECESRVSSLYRDAAREIRLLQLDMDYLVRRRIFFKNLSAEHPGAWWDDEYQMK
jgi:hypothetical protein